MKILAFFLAIFAFGTNSAQEYTFRVLINKGQNTVRAGNDWLPIKVGASLNVSDELRISQNGYMGLVHRSGKPLEVKEVGPHKISDLAARVKEGSSVLNKYTDFILSAKSEKKTNLTVTGAVHRGTGLIKVYLPKPQQAIVFNESVILSWRRNPESTQYIVQFNSMFGDELKRYELRDTTLSVDLNSEPFVNEDNIVVKVTSKNDPKIASDDFILKKLSAADKKRISSSMEPFEQMKREKNALNLLYLASFYEDNALLIDASSAYQEAMSLAPLVPDYREAFQQFVTRNTLEN